MLAAVAARGEATSLDKTTFILIDGLLIFGNVTHIGMN